MAKVSVVIPVYNVEPYLRERMESVVRQTLRDLEIICVNDGSTDGSPEILKEYAAKDSRVTVIDQENGGYGKAMNRGIDRASGEYLGIVEPDDYIGLTMYEDLYQKAKEDDLDLVKADFYRFYTDEEAETRHYVYCHLTRTPEAYRNVFRTVDRRASFIYAMNTWTGIYRLSFLREHQIRHQETPGAAFQDNGFWFQTFLYARRAEILDQPFYRVRRDNPNSSIRNPRKAYAMNIEYDYIRGILKRDPEAWEKLKGVYWRKRVDNYYATARRIDPALLPEYRARVSAEMKWGLKRGEFSREDFPECEREKMEALLNNGPLEIVYETEYMTPGEAQARAETKLIMNSASFRIGRAVTGIPRKIRDFLRKPGARGKDGE